MREYSMHGDAAMSCQNDDSQQCIALCSIPSVRRFQIAGNPRDPLQVEGDAISIAFNVTARTEYTMVLLTCAPTQRSEEVNLVLDITMLNPGGQHLSVEKIGLDIINGTGAAFYLILAAASFWIARATWRSSVLHRVLFAAIMAKALEMLLKMVYYLVMSANGTSKTDLTGATQIVRVVTQATFLLLLLMISLGSRRPVPHGQPLVALRAPTRNGIRPTSPRGRGVGGGWFSATRHAPRTHCRTAPRAQGGPLRACTSLGARGSCCGASSLCAPPRHTQHTRDTDIEPLQ
jgi:hypothetical protein